MPVRSHAASSVKNLKLGSTYSYDLDGDGVKEKLKFKFTEEGKYKIYINGKVKKTITLGEYYYSPCLQVMDIDQADGVMDLFVYAYASSDDISYSALYRYQDGKITRIWNLGYGKDTAAAFYQVPGYVTKCDGKGNFYVAMDRALKVDQLVGNHIDQIKYKIKDGKVSRVSQKTFYFAETCGYDENGEFGRNVPFKCARKLTFYKEHNKKDGSFTLKKGTLLTPVKIYIVSEKSVYVQFKTASGKIGWLRAGDYSWEELPFSNLAFFD